MSLYSAGKQASYTKGVKYSSGKSVAKNSTPGNAKATNSMGMKASENRAPDPKSAPNQGKGK